MLIAGTRLGLYEIQSAGEDLAVRYRARADSGVVAFEMLTGQRLFTGETISDTLASVLRSARIAARRLPVGGTRVEGK